jgi:hypothetical protein
MTAPRWSATMATIAAAAAVSALYFGVLHGGAPDTQVDSKVETVVAGPDGSLYLQVLATNASRHQILVTGIAMVFTTANHKTFYGLGIGAGTADQKAPVSLTETPIALSPGESRVFTETWDAFELKGLGIPRFDRAVAEVITIGGRHWHSDDVRLGAWPHWSYAG